MTIMFAPTGGVDVPLVPEHSLEVSWTEASHRPLAGGMYNISRRGAVGGGNSTAGIKGITGLIARVEATGIHHYLPMVYNNGIRLHGMGQYIRTKYRIVKTELSNKALCRNAVKFPIFSVTI